MFYKRVYHNDSSRNLDVLLGEYEISSSNDNIEHIIPGELVYLGNSNLSNNYYWQPLELLDWDKKIETRSYLLIYFEKNLISYIGAKKELTKANQQSSDVKVFQPHNFGWGSQPSISNENAKLFDIRTIVNNGFCAPNLAALPRYWVVIVRDIFKKEQYLFSPSLEKARVATHFFDFQKEYYNKKPSEVNNLSYHYLVEASSKLGGNGPAQPANIAPTGIRNF